MALAHQNIGRSEWYTHRATLGLTLGRPRSHQPRSSAGGASASSRDVPSAPAGLSSRRRQGLTLVHFSAQLKRFLRDWGYI